MKTLLLTCIFGLWSITIIVNCVIVEECGNEQCIRANAIAARSKESCALHADFDLCLQRVDQIWKRFPNSLSTIKPLSGRCHPKCFTNDLLDVLSQERCTPKACANLHKELQPKDEIMFAHESTKRPKTKRPKSRRPTKPRPTRPPTRLPTRSPTTRPSTRPPRHHTTRTPIQPTFRPHQSSETTSSSSGSSQTTSSSSSSDTKSTKSSKAKSTKSSGSKSTSKSTKSSGSKSTSKSTKSSGSKSTDKSTKFSGSKSSKSSSKHSTSESSSSTYYLRRKRAAKNKKKKNISDQIFKWKVVGGGKCCRTMMKRVPFQWPVRYGAGYKYIAHPVFCPAAGGYQWIGQINCIQFKCNGICRRGTTVRTFLVTNYRPHPYWGHCLQMWVPVWFMRLTVSTHCFCAKE